uniref:Uncharacterized protein n=1 Tax=Oryza rufipogon TaxID=4529 RepID=A0A0E0P631_ORYRU
MEAPTVAQSWLAWIPATAAVVVTVLPIRRSPCCCCRRRAMLPPLFRSSFPQSFQRGCRIPS